MAEASSSSASCSEFPSDEGEGRVELREVPPPAGALHLESGTTVGRYVVLFQLGHGGMGQVYVAYDPKLDRKVALKIVRPARGRTATDKRHARLRAEAHSLAKLAHPNVVAIHDVGVHELQSPRGSTAVLFLAMEYVEGQTLKQWLAQARTVREILRAFVQAGEGLRAAHEAGIVHRDFKPDNVIVGKEGRVQVLDFGLALPRVTTESSEVGGALVGRPRARKPPRRAGTPGYMAPEQHRGTVSGPAVDQFSYCVALFEALYGQLPFAGQDAEAINDNVEAGRIDDPGRGRRVPYRLRRVLERGLRARPADRYPSMDALLAELRRRPDRVRKRIAVVVVSSATVGAATWAYARGLDSTATACSGGPTRMAEVWNDDAREQLRTTFGRSSRAHAPATREQLETALDTFASAWTSQYRNACEATHVHAEQSETLLDQRMACLDQGLATLGASLGVLQDADDDVIDRAPQLLDTFADPSACSRRATLGLAPPLPRDPEARAHVSELLQRLARVRAMIAAGRTTQMRHLAESALERARVLGLDTLVAEALLVYGTVLETEGAYEDAATALREGALAAERAGHLERTVDIRTLLVSVLGDRLSRLDQAHLWADLARAALQRLGDKPRHEAELENAVALLVKQESRPEDALGHQRRAVALAESASGFPELELANYYTNLAHTLADLGRHDEALRRAAAAREIWVRRLGASHPRMAIAYSTSGLIHDAKGDYRAALRHHETAYDHLVAIFGAQSPRAAEVLNNVAIAAANLGDSERSHAAFSTLLRLRQAEYPDDHPLVARAHHNLATSNSLRGDLDTALQHYRAALSMRERLFGPTHPQIVGSLEGVANALERQGDPTAAIELRRRGLAIESRVYGDDHPALTLTLANLAHNAMVVGALDEALQTAERALQNSLATEMKLDLRAFARLVLARVLAERRESPQRVRSLVAEARRELGDLPAETERKLLEEIQTMTAKATK